ncbi:HupE/UreJ family protein [Microbacterium hydrothermale]|uniref:HupE/UreJ family protein n=1 Tax=Microbacterium hydrothermale TaxID=857427 RepID=UPI0010A944FE|nr:HupE/UreJ family protein [Microbacterium hydrothermale]
MSILARRILTRLLFITALVAAILPLAGPVWAHGFQSVVYADLSAEGPGVVRAQLLLEYDLLVVSVADAERDDPLYREGTAAFETGDAAQQAAALAAHHDTVADYVTARFTISAAGGKCAARMDDDISMTWQDGAPYAVVTVENNCPPSGNGHDIASTLFPDAEGFVSDTKTILTYALDLHEGSTVLDAEHPSFTTAQSTLERFWEFFRLGAEHLLTGIDHILFLLALIVGSRRLREIVIAATTFTIAHSVTFILAATGVISAPPEVVEPTIALSIAVVAAWYLWRLIRGDRGDQDLTATHGFLRLDRAGWSRVVVVFVFGLVHGLGFASALGIDEPWSWTLLWSLLVFNVGIEAVQIGIIVVVFPLLVLLRRRAPRVGMWVSAAVAVVVTAAGLVWFVQRLLGIE